MDAGFRIGWQGEQLPVSRWESKVRQFGYAGALLCMAGVVTSPAILSLGIVIVMLAGIIAVPFREQFRRFVQHRPAVLMSMLFMLQLLSGIWTREMGLNFWLEELKIKMPLFLGMYGFAVLGPYTERQVRIAWLVLLAGTFLVGTGTVIDYVLHTEEINQRIMVSKEVSVWLGCNHIYFSIVMAFSILANVWSLTKPTQLFFKQERWVILGVLLVCFVEMHVLTTRTGLVGLYLTALLVGWVMLLRQRRFLLAIGLAVGLAAMPVLGFFTIDSFKHRIDNTVMDLTEYFKGNDPNYLSIGTRLESWKTAVHLWQKNPILGVAMADLKADMTDQYVEDKTKLCPENFQQPHNQFLQNLAGWGIVGFLLVSLAWFYPALSRRWPKDLIFWIFWLNYSFAMLGESTMERQVGVCFLVPGFMLSLGIGRFKGPSSVDGEAKAA